MPPDHDHFSDSVSRDDAEQVVREIISPIPALAHAFRTGGPGLTSRRCRTIRPGRGVGHQYDFGSDGYAEIGEDRRRLATSCGTPSAPIRYDEQMAGHGRPAAGDAARAISAATSGWRSCWRARSRSRRPRRAAAHTACERTMGSPSARALTRASTTAGSDGSPILPRTIRALRRTYRGSRPGCTTGRPVQRARRRRPAGGAVHYGWAPGSASGAAGGAGGQAVDRTHRLAVVAPVEAVTERLPVLRREHPGRLEQPGQAAAGVQLSGTDERAGRASRQAAPAWTASVGHGRRRRRAGHQRGVGHH